MKYLLLILIATTSTLTFAQPKKATQIFIHNENTSKENFDLATTVLIENTVNISDRDKELGLIRTEPFSRSNISLTLYCTDSTVRVTGTFKSGMEISLYGVTATDEPEAVTNRGMKGSVYRKAFDEMDIFAKKLGDNVSYK